MYYEEIFREFNKNRVRYLVVGGLAVNLHGVPRMTQDIDLLVDMGRANLVKMINTLTELGYKPRPPVAPMDFADEEKRREWIEKKNMKVFTFFHKTVPVQEVDILIVSPVEYGEAARNKVVIKTDLMTIPIAGVADLIKMKKPVGRTSDLYDIKMLRIYQRISRRERG